MGSLFSSPRRGDGRAVLITGCDTGFGRLLSERLHKIGFLVYAGCLTSAAVNELREMGVNAFQMDVASPESRNNALQMLEMDLGKSSSSQNARGLYALVNNAGIAKGFWMDWSSEEDLRQTFEVDFFAPTLLAKAFLPLLFKYSLRVSETRLPKARILNVSSVASRIALPGMGPYCAAKHALRAMSGSMRAEFDSNGVHVVDIQPAFHNTNIISFAKPGGPPSTAVQLFRKLPDSLQAAYGGEIAFKKNVEEQSFKRINKDARDPKYVIDAMVHELLAELPGDDVIVSDIPFRIVLCILETAPRCVKRAASMLFQTGTAYTRAVAAKLPGKLMPPRLLWRQDAPPTPE